MRYGLSLPPFGDFANARFLAEAARQAEEAGWEGFFIWDHVFFDPSFHPNLDPWVGLAGAALATTRMRIGTMVTPLARRRPWKVVRETVTLDRLSDGRLTLGVGLGDPVQWDYGYFHEETDAKTRAKKLDEALDILTQAWTGQPLTYHGEHFHVEGVPFTPTPIQTPRIPIWVGGNFPNKPPMRRAARWDGYVPIKFESALTPEDCREVMAYIKQHRTSDMPFDLVVSPLLPDNAEQARDRLRQFADAGVTWWLAPLDPWSLGADWEVSWQPDYAPKMLDWIDRGPVKI